MGRTEFPDLQLIGSEPWLDMALFLIERNGALRSARTRTFKKNLTLPALSEMPVFLSRRPDESTDFALSEFYEELLGAVDRPVFREGQWSLCERTGWPDNASFQNLVAWNWVKEDQRYWIVVNLSDVPSQAKVQVPWVDAGGGKWNLLDVPSGVNYVRDGDEMLSPGIYVELGPWNYHFFQCVRTNKA